MPIPVLHKHNQVPWAVGFGDDTRKLLTPFADRNRLISPAVHAEDLLPAISARPGALREDMPHGVGDDVVRVLRGRDGVLPCQNAREAFGRDGDNGRADADTGVWRQRRRAQLVVRRGREEATYRLTACAMSDGLSSAQIAVGGLTAK